MKVALMLWPDKRTRVCSGCACCSAQTCRTGRFDKSKSQGLNHVAKCRERYLERHQTKRDHYREKDGGGGLAAVVLLRVALRLVLRAVQLVAVPVAE
jgi:hypothetical protein